MSYISDSQAESYLRSMDDPMWQWAINEATGRSIIGVEVVWYYVLMGDDQGWMELEDMPVEGVIKSAVR